jgi:hypothetical protein
MFLDKGFNAFKMKVGSDIEDDKRRLRCAKFWHLFSIWSSFFEIWLSAKYV